MKKGDLLFQINPIPFEVALAQAEAAAKQAEMVAQRNVELFARKTISEQERDNAVLQSAAATANVDGQRAAVRQAQVNLDYASVKSPIDGIAGLPTSFSFKVLLVGSTGLIARPSMPLANKSLMMRVCVAAVPSSGILNSTFMLPRSFAACEQPARARVQKSAALFGTKARVSFLPAAWVSGSKVHIARRQSPVTDGKESKCFVFTGLSDGSKVNGCTNAFCVLDKPLG